MHSIEPIDIVARPIGVEVGYSTRLVFWFWKLAFLCSRPFPLIPSVHLAFYPPLAQIAPTLSHLALSLDRAAPPLSTRSFTLRTATFRLTFIPVNELLRRPKCFFAQSNIEPSSLPK